MDLCSQSAAERYATQLTALCATEAPDQLRFAVAVVGIFRRYPEPVVRAAVDVHHGLPGKLKWPLRLADVVEELDARMEPHREAERQAREQETAGLLAPPEPASQEARDRAFAYWQLLRETITGTAMPIGEPPRSATKADLERFARERQERERKDAEERLTARAAEWASPVTISEPLAKKLQEMRQWTTSTAAPPPSLRGCSPATRGAAAGRTRTRRRTGRSG